MAATTQNTNNTTIRSILQQEKLTGPNFTNWFQNLRIVLRSEGKLAHLGTTIDPSSITFYISMLRVLHITHCTDEQNEVACHILGEVRFRRTKRNSETAKGKDRGVKGKDKGKNKLAYAPKPKIPPPPKRDNPTKDSIYHQCKEVGHWRRNCPSYQAELNKRKEGLKRSKKLKHRALSLYIGNGMRAAVEAIGNFDLILPSGLIILAFSIWFQPRRLKGRLMKYGMEKLPGYPKETMGYYFYYLENKIFVARNAEFFENNLIVQEASGSHGPLKMSGSDEGLELIQEEDTQPSENTSEDHNEVVPMEILVELPPNGQTDESKWLFKKKADMDDNVQTFKACLVAKGYTQTYGVDYGKTFSPVAVIRGIRILLAIAAFYDYEIWQMDIKTAFLNCHLSEDVYMVQTEGFVDPNHPNKVCKLQCSIYGLKQASGVGIKGLM
ncbi:retrotransposon protein, putative, ty1-copia subclass [Tanacetum coccineum]